MFVLRLGSFGVLMLVLTDWLDVGVFLYVTIGMGLRRIRYLAFDIVGSGVRNGPIKWICTAMTWRSSGLLSGREDDQENQTTFICHSQPQPSEHLRPSGKWTDVLKTMVYQVLPNISLLLCPHLLIIHGYGH